MPSKEALDRILRMEDKSYDGPLKWLLHYKFFIALVVKNKIEDYKDLSTREIAELIVSVSDTKTSRVEGDESEDNTLEDGYVRYDSLTTLRLPGKDDELSQVRLNIEAQNRDNMLYELATRGLFYCCRLISSQKGTFFNGSDYQNIRKVYSIWLVLNPRKERRGYSNVYVITEKKSQGSYSLNKKDFDLLEVIIVNCKCENSLDPVIGFLDTFLSTKLSQEEIIQKIRKDYEVEVTEDFEEEVDSMCSLSEYFMEAGIEAGEAKRQAAIKMLVSAMNENGEALKIPEVFADDNLLAEYFHKYGIGSGEKRVEI